MLSNLGKYLFGETMTAEEKAADETQASLQSDLDTSDGDLGWVLVDHAPSTERVRTELEPNPLEDLLIEYPSIEFLNQDHQARLTANIRLFSEGEELVPPAQEAVVERVVPGRHRVIASDTQENTIFHASRREQRKAISRPLSRKNLERSNKVNMVRSCGRKHAAARDRVLRPSFCMNSRHAQRH